ncbi:MAG: hypothetical protein NUV53_01635 [Patescibacteria group bacterium]|nr:hypothetical protein [Patescibacteria group bacterium]
MLKYQCDKCKKEIRSRGEMISVGKGAYASLMLCAQCGKPIELFLSREKLLDNEKITTRKR